MGRSLAPGETMACPWYGVLGRPLAWGPAETGHGQGLLQVSEFWQLAELLFKERNESVLMEEGSGCTARAGGVAGGPARPGDASTMRGHDAHGAAGML